MLALNLPPAQLSIRLQETKKFVFDRLRRQYVRLTPEEWVRQHFIHYLIEQKSYPEGLLANEVSIVLGNVSRRCDTVLYDSQLRPRMIIEYKAPSVAITQNVFDQILRYNMRLNVNYLIVSNGLQHFCCKINGKAYSFLKEIPEYGKIE
ncbi:MAG: type I restriction enzyme HsdR N-terminal domain-containing protein [Dysgonamonadaceae bacterium]|jgi:hypothetical protein|nr:type I restriction enzyme HsdR N-terminal domain-containing protein [Dysgonamonadaceae bacterium]